MRSRTMSSLRCATRCLPRSRPQPRAPPPDMPQGLLRATLTLLAGGVVAQTLPLLLGPWLTRLYTPDDWGQYTAFAAVAANIAVVACARYDFALPLARDEAEARDLMALCLRVLLVVVGASAVLGAALEAGG